MTPKPEPPRQTVSDEAALLIEAVWQRRGVDFRDYAPATIERRLSLRAEQEGVGSICELRARALQDPECLGRVADSLTIHVSAMFRDPEFYACFRAEVVPVLRTYPFLRFWVAGCSTGEEAFSLAILLHEEGLYSRSRVYATDLSESKVEKARAGLFPLAAMRDFTRNYQLAGGRSAFAAYYAADHESAIFRSFLRENMVFAVHNLAQDASFNEFHAILCRNVMIYFNRPLQDRVHHLLHGSLVMFGFLGLGRGESVRFSSFGDCYQALSPKERLYGKIK